VNDKSKSPPASQASKVSARRRLLRGAFSAPALLTVYSGSAMATSSPLRCVINQHATPVHPTALTSAPTSSERYLRVRVYTGNDAGMYVMGSEITPFVRRNVTAYITSSQVQRVTPDTIPGVYSAPVAWADKSPYTAINKWVALRVDSSGKIIGVVGAGSGGTAIAGTCWTSFGTTSA